MAGGPGGINAEARQPAGQQRRTAGQRRTAHRPSASQCAGRWCFFSEPVAICLPFQQSRVQDSRAEPLPTPRPHSVTAIQRISHRPIATSYRLPRTARRSADRAITTRQGSRGPEAGLDEDDKSTTSEDLSWLLPSALSVICESWF